MKKKALFLFLIAAIAILAYLYTRPSQPVLSIDKAYGMTEVGQTVLVNVTLIDFPSCSGWLINLNWDPYYVKLTSGTPARIGAPPYVVIEGPFMKSSGATLGLIFNYIDNERGQMIVGDQFLQAGHTANGTTGVILAINFTVVNVGTTTLVPAQASPVVNQSIVADVKGAILDHAEVAGLITDKSPPPIWEGMEFQTTLIVGEIVVLLAATGIVYWRTHPRTAKSERRKAELQPIFDSKDQGESS